MKKTEKTAQYRDPTRALGELLKQPPKIGISEGKIPDYEELSREFCYDRNAGPFKKDLDRVVNRVLSKSVMIDIETGEIISNRYAARKFLELIKKRTYIRPRRKTNFSSDEEWCDKEAEPQYYPGSERLTTRFIKASLSVR
jgi:hypothetical protein